jgi:hypothetical protein
MEGLDTSEATIVNMAVYYAGMMVTTQVNLRLYFTNYLCKPYRYALYIFTSLPNSFNRNAKHNTGYSISIDHFVTRVDWW